MYSVLFAENLLPTRLRHAVMTNTHTIQSREYNVVQKACLELLGFERHELGQPLFAPLPKTQKEVCVRAFSLVIKLNKMSANKNFHK